MVMSIQILEVVSLLPLKVIHAMILTNMELMLEMVN